MIDWGRVAELREDVGAEVFGEVKEIFLEEAEQVLARLEDGASGSWEEDFHCLKSAALNMGFAEVARLCQDAEIRARSGEAGPADAAAVTASFRASIAAFEQGRPA
ncbi:MAG: Hpt domain-containing protein [Vannielia sp.]|uniref:Hpt domain-containing protein n=1 Tax=Rhodobacterales TaxID=204455 RepID=UPI0020965B3B|nr:Hpt domain-containing protein [Oceanicola sp. 502str15]MCO6384375.1 Hpt domain-containing protein [Oceanicola sp. 502str15]